MPFLAKGSHLGIVVEKDTRAQAALDDIADGIVGPSGKVGRHAHHAGFDIDDAGNADTCAHELSAAAIFFGQVEDGVAHLADNVVASHGEFYAHSYFFEKLTVSGDGRDAQVRTAHINANGVVRHNGREYQKRARAMRLLAPLLTGTAAKAELEVAFGGTAEAVP